MHGGVMSAEIRGFTREKQGVGQGRGQLALRLLRASRQNIAVRSSRIGVGLPIVHVAGAQAASDLFWPPAQNSRQGFNGFLFQ